MEPGITGSLESLPSSDCVEELLNDVAGAVDDVDDVDDIGVACVVGDVDDVDDVSAAGAVVDVDDGVMGIFACCDDSD